MRFRPAVVPSVGTGIGLVILMNLGFWQLSRHQQAQVRIAEVEGRLFGEPASNTDLNAPADTLIWRKASVTGQFIEPPALVAGHVEFGDIGYDVMQAFAVDQGPTILVQRGWIPHDGWSHHLDSIATGGTTQVDGLLQAVTGEPAIAPLPATDAKPERWPQETAPFLLIGRKRIGPPYAAIAATLPSNPDLLLVAGPELTKGQPKRRSPLPVGGYVATPKEIGHMAYAVQWFLIAATLAVIWVVASIRRDGAASEQGL